MALFKFNTKDSSKCLLFPFKASITYTTPQQTHKNAICPALQCVSQPFKTSLSKASPNLFFTFEIMEDALEYSLTFQKITCLKLGST